LEGRVGTSESHRQFCHAAFKSFKLAYSGIALANARQQIVCSRKRPDVEHVTLVPQARLSLAAASRRTIDVLAPH
jgi:hypothetical protein